MKKMNLYKMVFSRKRLLRGRKEFVYVVDFGKLFIYWSFIEYLFKIY